MRYLVVSFLIFESAVWVWVLAQGDMLPNELSSILIQLPIVGMFVWYVLHTNKQNREWLDSLLGTQDQRHQRTIELLTKIIERMDTRQGQSNDRIEILTQQLAINTSTVNESMRLGELREVLEKLASKE